jgi:ribonuclease D
LAAARAAVAAIADEHGMPTENLLAPDIVRRLAWAPPADVDRDVVAEFLRSHGARAWQVNLTRRRSRSRCNEWPPAADRPLATGLSGVPRTSADPQE